MFGLNCSCILAAQNHQSATSTPESKPETISPSAETDGRESENDSAIVPAAEVLDMQAVIAEELKNGRPELRSTNMPSNSKMFGSVELIY